MVWKGYPVVFHKVLTCSISSSPCNCEKAAHGAVALWGKWPSSPARRYQVLGMILWWKIRIYLYIQYIYYILYTRISWNGQFLLLLLRQVPSAVEHYFNSMDQNLAEISTSGPSARDVTSRNCGTLRLIVSPAAMEGNHSKAVYKVNLTSREPNCQGLNQMQSLIFEMISNNHPCLLNVVLMAKHGETSLHQAGTSIVQLCAMELALRSNSEWFHVFHLSPRCGIKWSVLSGVPMMGTWSDMKNSESSWITWMHHVT